MAKCFECKTEINKTVYEKVTGKEIPMCDECRDSKFSKCENCGEFYYNDEIKNGFCEACHDNLY